MAITYSAPTITVSGFSEVTPCTMHDIYLADIAGESTLLAAAACTVDMMLTDQIRPCAKPALQISFILAGTSAGAGDTLDITGTDWDGNVQNESIDVSAGDGTYTGANKWQTIIDIDCTGWADGTLAVTQPQWGVVNELIQDVMYEINANLYTLWNTTTWMKSTRETIHINGALQVGLKGTFILGKTDDGRGYEGSTLQVSVGGLITYVGTMEMYGSLFRSTSAGTHTFYNGYIKCQNTIIDCCENGAITFDSGVGVYFKDVFIQNLRQLFIKVDIAQWENVILHRTFVYGLYMYVKGATRTFPNFDIANKVSGYSFTSAGAGTVRLVDSKVLIESLYMTANDFYLEQWWTCNIHISDKDGADLSGVTVACVDVNEAACFSVETDANGDIAEQEIKWKSWTSTSETLTDYSPHKFTFSKAGYETIVMENIDITVPIVWKLELQDEIRRYPVIGGGHIIRLQRAA